MNIVRSILGVVFGLIVAVMAISGVEAISGALYPPPFEIKMDSPMAISAESKAKLLAWMPTQPTEAHVMVLLAWMSGAFIGGAVSASIAGWGRLVHAGIIGAFVVLATFLNSRDFPDVHPDWMMIAAYLLPIPLSLLAGWLVGMLRPAGKVEPS